jgi:hypothetical protein
MREKGGAATMPHPTTGKGETAVARAAAPQKPSKLLIYLLFLALAIGLKGATLCNR